MSLNCGEREGKGAGGAERETLTHSSTCPPGSTREGGVGEALCLNGLHCRGGGWFPPEAPDPGQLVSLTLFCVSQVLLIITNLPPSAMPCSPLLIPMSWNHEPDSQPNVGQKSLPFPT